jgi:polyketide cyclase/dehydrase/lipid transport protein
MRSWSADSSAPPSVAWSLLSRPDAWPAWSPHVRGAWGLGDGEVRAGARGAARLFGVLPVPARITGRSPRSWTWEVGLVEMTHRVDAQPGGGSRVTIELRAPGPLEAPIALAYGPVIAYTLRRLARVAGMGHRVGEEDPGP